MPALPPAPPPAPADGDTVGVIVEELGIVGAGLGTCAIVSLPDEPAEPAEFAGALTGAGEAVAGDAGAPPFAPPDPDDSQPPTTPAQSATAR